MVSGYDGLRFGTIGPQLSAPTDQRLFERASGLTINQLEIEGEPFGKEHMREYTPGIPGIPP